MACEARRGWRQSPSDVRLVVSVLLGLAGTWASTVLSSRSLPLDGSVHLHAHWDFLPDVMAGFPVHGIPGHGNAGAHGRQSWQGVLAILANWAFWTTVAWLALLPARRVPRIGRLLSLAAALVATAIAVAYFASTLD